MEPQKFNFLLKRIRFDEKAMAEIYEFYYPRIVKRMSIKYGMTLAEDIAQDCLLHIWEVCDKQKYIEKPTSWIYTCADNIAKRKITYDSRYTSFIDETASTATMDAVENDIYIKELFENLNETERKILNMFYLEGYSNKEIAEMIGMKPTNVRKIHSRAIKKLKSFI